MLTMKRVLPALLFAAYSWLAVADQPDAKAQRDESQRAFDAGNFKVAFDGFRKLALDPKDDSRLVAGDLQTAIAALERLGRVDEIDDFREAAVGAHRQNWRLLDAAATSYLNVDHQGFIVAGKFYRGGRRGGGKYVTAVMRDRVRALQLMHAALPFALTDDDRKAVSQFHLRFANDLLVGGGYYEPWKLQALTDFSQLPDFDEGYVWHGNTSICAPVDAEGKPVFFHVPKNFESAQSDGERWRWFLSQAVEFDAASLNDVQMTFANFLRGQFGVQTLAHAGRWFSDDDKKDESGTYALNTLSDEETIARLATGIKRFKLPDEFNHIKIYEQVAARGKSPQGEAALDVLTQIFEDRRQYVKAAESWKRAIREYGPGRENVRRQRLEQIVGNWGRFEAVPTQPAGKGATVEFRFRNASRVSFAAREVNVEKLLAD
ncbi:MAG TPA: alpha-2-macroglobulin, partial [Planctomycetaceae bacterium]|nr:alpha-2-macroglobulin [Planctomycetaceae bacterium]